MARLYRTGIIKDWGSSWFPTIREAKAYYEDSGESRNPKENVIGIMWMTQQAFNKHFETKGIGFRAKNESAFLNATPVIQYLDIDRLEQLLENPMTCRIYGDAETIQRLEFP